MTERPYKGAVIFGFPRSGTTMLRRLLDAHPLLCCPPETHIMRACVAFLHEDASPLGYSVGVATSLRFVGIKPEDVTARVRDLAFGLYKDICDKAGKPIWVEKSALDFFHAHEVDRIFGDHCRYLWIKRHPGDVISSMQDHIAGVQVYYPEFHDYIRRFPAPAEAFAHAWADTQSAMADLAAAHPERCLEIRYEDLVADPQTGLQRILDFLGLEGDPQAMLGGLSTAGEVGFGDWKTYSRTAVNAESVGRSRTLPPRLLARIGEIVNPTLTRIGYEPIEVAASALRMDPVRELKLGHFTAHSAAVRAQQAGDKPA